MSPPQSDRVSTHSRLVPSSPRVALAESTVGQQEAHLETGLPALPSNYSVCSGDTAMPQGGSYISGGWVGGVDIGAGEPGCTRPVAPDTRLPHVRAWKGAELMVGSQ